MGIEPVQAVAVRVESEDWEDPDLQLPMDYAEVVEAGVLLLGMVLFIAFVLVRSVQ